jgi:hypothetical protein
LKATVASTTNTSALASAGSGGNCRWLSLELIRSRRAVQTLDGRLLHGPIFRDAKLHIGHA